MIASPAGFIEGIVHIWCPNFEHWIPLGTAGLWPYILKKGSDILRIEKDFSRLLVIFQNTMLKNHSKSLIRIEVNSVVCDTNFSCLFTFDKIFSCLFTCDVQLFVYIWYEFQLLVYINRTDISCLLTFIIHMSAVCLWLAIESWCKSPNETILVYFQTLWYLLVFKAHDRKASSEQNWILSSCKKSLFKLTIFGSL